MKRYWPAILFVALAVALWPSFAGAQDQRVTVTSSRTFPILIDGDEIIRFPASAHVGSKACILTPLDYVSDEERVKFQGWSGGTAVETEVNCVTPDQPGEYEARYSREFLLTINSQVKEFRQNRWVPRGVPITLALGDLLEEDGRLIFPERPGVRFIFDQWSAGETRFSPQNTIVLNRPFSIEIKWTKELFLQLEAPSGVELAGQGWYADGATAVLNAPSTAFSPEEDERHQFTRWEVTSDPAIVTGNAQQPTTQIRITGTHTIRAEYELAYRVVVETHLGTLINDFFLVGSDVVFEAEASIDINPDQERLTFIGWEGADVDKPKGSVEVHEPLKINALYQTEFRVDVRSPYGVTSGIGWFSEGAVATVRVPEDADSLFFLTRSFNGYSGFPSENATFELPVTGPVTITATYTTSINLRFLIPVVAGLIVVGIVYYISQQEYNRRRRRSRW